MTSQSVFSQAQDKEQRAVSWAPLAVILCGTFVFVLDFFIVNVALPAIQRGLAASPAAIEWVVAGYALTSAALLVTGGRLGDVYGRRKIFCVGVAGFTLTSAVCALAPDAGFLVANLGGLGWRVLFWVNVPIATGAPTAGRPGRGPAWRPARCCWRRSRPTCGALPAAAGSRCSTRPSSPSARSGPGWPASCCSGASRPPATCCSRCTCRTGGGCRGGVGRDVRDAGGRVPAHLAARARAHHAVRPPGGRHRGGAGRAGRPGPGARGSRLRRQLAGGRAAARSVPARRGPGAVHHPAHHHCPRARRRDQGRLGVRRAVDRAAGRQRDRRRRPRSRSTTARRRTSTAPTAPSARRSPSGPSGWTAGCGSTTRTASRPARTAPRSAGQSSARPAPDPSGRSSTPG